MDLLLGHEIVLPLESLRIGVVVLGTAIAAYFDLFNKRMVPDDFLKAFLGISILLALVAYDPVATPYGFAAGFILFAANYILYKAGYLGGADVPIMAAIALLLPSQPTLLLHDTAGGALTFPFIIHVLTAAFLTFMLHVLVRSLPSVVRSIGKGRIQPMQWVGALAILAAYAGLVVMVSYSSLLSTTYLVFLAALAGVSVYFVLFRPVINESMMVWVPASKVEVEDIMAPDLMDAAVVKKYHLNRLVDEAQLKRLKNVKGKIPVYKNLLPFVPHLLIGLVLSLVFGNVLLSLVGLPLPAYGY